MPASAKTVKYEETQHGTGTHSAHCEHTQINVKIWCVPNIYLLVVVVVVVGYTCKI